MLSVNQVYNEPSTQPRKLKSGSSSGLGLKNATNSISRPVSESGREIKKKQFKAVKKNVVKAEQKTETKTVSFSDERWLEKENDCIYEDPEDDYEDILPKEERIQKSEIDCLFKMCSLGRSHDTIDDDWPIFEEELIQILEEPCSYTINYSNLYDDTHFEDIDLPDL